MDPITLQMLLDAFAATENGGAEAVRTLLADRARAHASDLRAQAADAFQVLYAGESRTPEDVAQMRVLHDVILLAREEEAARVAEAEAAAADADALAREALGEPETAAVEEEPAVDADVEAPAEEAVVASIPTQRPRVDLAALARRAPVPTPPAAPEDTAPVATIVASSDVRGFTAGQELTLDQLAEAELAVADLMPKDFVPGVFTRKQFGMVRKPVDESLVATGINDLEVLDRAADESRLEGGSLVAAGGWCAPSETWYDLCPGLESGAGLVSLPEVVASRGGVRWTKGPQFCDFYSGTGFFSQTEAQAIAGTEKPCYEIPCPDFTEVRLSVHGLCLTAGILQNRGYPEYVRRFIEGSLVAHAHRMNKVKIDAMVALSTAVSADTNGGALGATLSLLSALELHVVNTRYRFRMDPSRSLQGVAPLWLLPLLRSDLSKRTGQPLEQVTDQQLMQHFRNAGVLMEFVYDWQDAMCQVSRVVADGSTTSGSANLDSNAANFEPKDVGATISGAGIPAGTKILSVTDENTVVMSANATATATGVSVTVGTAGQMGADSDEVTVYPAQVKVLLFPAGTFVALTSDVITLESVYDSTLIKTNKYMALFTEEGLAVINRCYESLLLTVDVHPTGATSAPVTVTAPIV